MPDSLVEGGSEFSAAQHGLCFGEWQEVSLVGGTERGKVSGFGFVAEPEPPDELQQRAGVGRDFDTKAIDAEAVKHPPHRVTAQRKLVAEEAVEEHEVAFRASSLHYGI